MSKIPKIIHQTWKTADLPIPFKRLAQTWRKFLPDWEYILWTDDMNREFVTKYFPDFLEKYDSYPKNIQRADAIRYLLLKKHGGLYVDIDFECLDNIEPLLEEGEFIAGKEPLWHAQRFNMKHIVCNAFMASTPNNDFINSVCDRLLRYPSIEINHPIDILNSTGPFLLTHIYDLYPKKGTVRILEPETIYPIGLFETNKIIGNEISEDMEQRINKAYAIHYFLGNW